ncbi:MAG: hypothetical protein ACOX3H_10380 [Saccharofermentanales bacterium]
MIQTLSGYKNLQRQRVRCAVLAWRTLDLIIAKQTGTPMTE